MRTFAGGAGFIDELLRTANEGRILRRGIRAAIIGRPNVGKSSLLNQLLGHDRAIVSPIPGTTRDTIEETANVRGIPVIFIDTAGLREAADEIEIEGIRRSRGALADGRIDSSCPRRRRTSGRCRREVALGIRTKKAAPYSQQNRSARPPPIAAGHFGSGCLLPDRQGN